MVVGASQGGANPVRVSCRAKRHQKVGEEYDGDEVEAVKLFLTDDDGVAAALGFEKLERERESDRAE